MFQAEFLRSRQPLHGFCRVNKFAQLRPAEQPVVELKTIFRQAQASSIVKDAHLINQSIPPGHMKNIALKEIQKQYINLLMTKIKNYKSFRTSLIQSRTSIAVFRSSSLFLESLEIDVATSFPLSRRSSISASERDFS